MKMLILCHLVCLPHCKGLYITESFVLWSVERDAFHLLFSPPRQEGQAACAPEWQQPTFNQIKKCLTVEEPGVHLFLHLVL